MADSMDNLMNPNFTYSWDKYSCLRGAYFAHVVFCYLIFLSGIGAFVVRVIPPFKWTHVWFGRAYINSMLWATATSLLVHNTGLPTATLISFIWALGGMTIAWLLINIHQILMDKQAAHNVQEAIKLNGMGSNTSLEAMLKAEKGRIAASKTFRQRFFSIKALHGIIMFVSWINIAGRIFASNQSGDFTCHTYPVYKQIDTPHFQGADKPLTLVPVHDPDYARLPWAKTGLVGWGVAMSLGPFIGAAIVGAIYSLVAARKRASQNKAVSVKSAAAAAAEVPEGSIP